MLRTMAVQPGVTPGDVTTTRPGLGATIWMQHSPPLVIDQHTFLLDWTGHFFSSLPQPLTLTSPPSPPPQPRRTVTGGRQRKQTTSSHPRTLHCSHHKSQHRECVHCCLHYYERSLELEHIHWTPCWKIAVSICQEP